MTTPAASGEPRTTESRPSGITPKTKAQPPPPPFLVPLNIAFYICLVSHLLAASNAPIQDCDETFNYWEPLHYLTHGSGLQTWEYSPEFGIRSWAYVLIHALPTKLISFLGKSRSFEFYFLRCLLATICAATETRLYSTISRTLNSRIGVIYLVIVAFTPGFFYASSAFLPSTFAMYTVTLGLTAFMDLRGGPKTATAIMWFGMGALLGWPFAGALILPFVIEDWAVVFITGDWYDTFMRYVDGIVRCLTILGLQVSIDAFFYRQLLVVPWRIVMYNIFGGEDRGPDIFGTEPWHFYVRNLLLNFNIWYLLAMTVAPILLIQSLILKRSPTNQSFLRTFTFITPFYLWFAIFTLQPHKEERFMFPAYPFLALNASIALHVLISWFTTSNPSTLIGKIPLKFKLAIIFPILLLSVNIGLLRILGIVASYRAPLQIYSVLSDPVNYRTTKIGFLIEENDNDNLPSSQPSTLELNLCLGKDWYRFPSSFHLPSTTSPSNSNSDSGHSPSQRTLNLQITPRFIPSLFTGLLPTPFATSTTGFGFFPGTHLIPSGMNDRNIGDPSKLLDIKYCSFLVDSQFPSETKTDGEFQTQTELESEFEPDYISDTTNWDVVACVPFLDVAATGVIARILWVPDWDTLGLEVFGTDPSKIPRSLRRVWGRHCLLRKKGSLGEYVERNRREKDIWHVFYEHDYDEQESEEGLER